MSWVSVRQTTYTILVIAIAFVLGFGKGMGMGLTDNIASSGITPAHLIAVGLGVVIFWLYKGDL